MDLDYLRTHTVRMMLILVLILGGFAVLKTVVITPVQSQALWKGYDAFLVEEGHGVTPEEVSGILRSCGYEEVLHRGNQTVTMFSYDGLKELSLGEVRTRFLDVDPLVDPYVKGLERYYQGRLGSQEAFVLYARRGDQSLPAYLKLRQQLGRLDAEWSRGASNPVAHLILLTGAGLVVLLVSISLAGRFTPAVLLSLLFYALGVHTPDYSYVVAALFLLFGGAVWLRIGMPAVRRYLNSPEDVQTRNLLIPLAAYGVCAAAALFYPIAGGAGWLAAGHLLLGMAMQTVLTVICAFREFRRYSVQAHRLFYPVSMGIGTMRRIVTLPLRSWSSVLLLLLALPFAVEWGQGHYESVRMPVPVKSFYGADERGEGITYRELYEAHSQRRESKGTSANGLPTLSDYLAHRAYQEGYFYGRSYGFPPPGERITLKRYSGEGLRIESKENTVKMFTDDWYGDIIAEARQNGIEQLLYAQESPVQAQVVEVEPLRVSGDIKRGHVAVTAVLSLFLFMAMSWNVSTARVHRTGQTARERRKVA